MDLTGKSGKNQVSAEETGPISCPISSYSQKVVFYTLHPNISMHILHTVLYTFPYGADKENLFNSQKLFCLMTISYILVMCDSGVILAGEIRFKAPLGVIGLTEITFSLPTVVMTCRCW